MPRFFDWRVAGAAVTLAVMAWNTTTFQRYVFPERYLRQQISSTQESIQSSEDEAIEARKYLAECGPDCLSDCATGETRADLMQRIRLIDEDLAYDRERLRKLDDELSGLSSF